MGGGQKPGLISTPPPAPINPEATSSYLDILKNIGMPQVTSGLAGGSAPSKLGYSEGTPTKLGYDPNFNLQQTADIMQFANKRQTDQARGNILESFGSQGLRYSSPAGNAISDFESQNASDYLSQLRQLQLGYEPLKLQAAGLQAGLDEASKGRALNAAQSQGGYDESAAQRGLATNLSWLDAIKSMAESYYPTAQVVGGTPGQGGQYAQAGATAFMALMMLLAA